MHSKTVGRIDGLSAFYKDSRLRIGDEIILTYDETSGIIEIEEDEILFMGASGYSEESDPINQGRYRYYIKKEDIMVNLGIMYDNEEELREHSVLYVIDTHTNKKYRLFESQSDFSIVQIDNDKGLIHIKESRDTVRIYDIKSCKQVHWYKGDEISKMKYRLEESHTAFTGVTDVIVYEIGISKEVVRVRINDLSLDSVNLYDVRNDNIIIKCYTRFGEAYYVVCNLTSKVVDRYYSKERIVELVAPITDGWIGGKVYIKK